jgi:hypothetical protein
MGDGGGRAGLAPRLAGAIPAAFLWLTLVTRFSNAVHWSGLAGGVVLAGLFVLPLLYPVPRGRALSARHGAGCWRWRPQGSWLLFGAVLAVEAEYNMRSDG